MENSDYCEVEISDVSSIREFIDAIKCKQKEMVLLSDGEVVGAVLTAEQYAWFLDQIDAQADLSFVSERATDLKGAQSLNDLKKELGE